MRQELTTAFRERIATNLIPAKSSLDQIGAGICLLCKAMMSKSHRGLGDGRSAESDPNRLIRNIAVWPQDEEVRDHAEPIANALSSRQAQEATADRRNTVTTGRRPGTTWSGLKAGHPTRLRARPRVPA